MLRPVLRCNSNTVSDVTIGVLAPAHHNITREPLLNPVMTLTLEVPAINSPIVTWAYPETQISNTDDGRHKLDFRPNFYDGILEACFPNGRDTVMLPFPCYQGSITVLGGASGGPVLNEKGRVFGVNCTGYDGTNLSFFARINEILPLWIDDAEFEGAKRDKLTVIELARKGHILFKPKPRFE